MGTLDRVISLRRQDVNYKAFFLAPQFPLLFAPARFYDALHSRLSKYGLRLADLKAEGNIGNPAEFSLVCSLLAHNTVLRITAELIEVAASSPPDAGVLTGIAGAALEALREIAGGAFKPLSSQQVLWEAHAELHTGTARDYLVAHVIDPTWHDRQVSGVSVAMHLGPDAEQQIGGAVVIAPSAVFPGHLYVQVNATFDGSVPLTDVAARFSRLQQDALSRFRLTVKEVPR